MEHVDTNERADVAGASSPLTRRTILKGLVGAAAAIPAVSLLGGGGASAAGRSLTKGAGRAATWSYLRQRSQEAVTLNLVYFGDTTQQATWDALFAAFNESNPDVTIEATGIPATGWGNYASTVATQLAGGADYDIVYMATEGQRLFASKGVLLPLDDYIAADQEIIDDYFADVDPNLREWTLKYGSPDGSTYYIPGGYNTMVMYCNIEVFEAAGVDLKDDWTWDEFHAAGVAIKEATGGFLHPMGSGFPFGATMPWLLTNGASTMDEDWATATFNSAAAVESAEFVKKCIADELSPVPGGEFDALAQLSDGNLASIGGGRWVTGDIRRLELVDKIRIVNWPTNTTNGSPVGWDGWPIMRASKNPDAAWTFLRWLTTTDASVYYAEIGGTNIPARNSVATSESFLANAPVGSELLAAAVSYATPIPSPDNLPDVDTAINDGWSAAITGQKPVQDALDEANDAIQAAL